MSRIRLYFLILLLLCTTQTSFAQQQGPKPNIRPQLRKGNELYNQKKYKEAVAAYTSALQKDPTSYTGMFNIGDALYNEKQYENARQAMAASTKATKDKKEQARAYHNIGNTFMKEQKWEEAINAYKQSLRLDPSDADTKYNLAYANAMLKKNGGKDNNKDKNKDNKDNKDNKNQDKDKKDDKKDQDKKEGDNKKDQDKKDGDKDDKQDQGDKDKKEQPRPQGQPSKLSQQQAENLLNALRQEEKKLQDKKEKGKAVPIKLEKDW